MGTVKRPPISTSSASIPDRQPASASASSSSAGGGASTSASASRRTGTSIASEKQSAAQSATAASAASASNSAASASGRPTPPRQSDTMSRRSASEEADGEPRVADRSHLILLVCQQPERARLCSYKEENDTVDRRPVDPPPVVELATTLGTFPDLLDSAQFFIRASLVSAEATPGDGGSGDKYTAIKTPTGADPTSGEVIQTPERLKHLDGSPGALCIFPKLSVRLPGVFRLKFTLFETSEEGLSEITHVISAPFEVFSPKLFKGMHESTRLTRHLANQGLKVKLRTDPNGGKGSNRRRASVASVNAPPGRGSPPGNGPHVRHPTGHLLSAPLAVGPASAPPYTHQRNLVWHSHYHHRYIERDRSPDEPHRKRARPNDWRDGRDDGLFELSHISSKLDLAGASSDRRNGLMAVPSPSSDLSAFSLGGHHPMSPPAGGYRWGRESGADDGFPSFPMHSSSAPPPRRQMSDPRDPRDPRDLRDLRDLRDPRDPRDPRDHDLRDPRDPRDLRSADGYDTYRDHRARDYPDEPPKGSPRVVSPEERQLVGRERELARERDMARERVKRERERETDLAWERERELAWAERRGHWMPPSPVHPPHYRAYSPRHSQAPLPHDPPQFALPRLPPIVAGEDPRGPPHPGHPYSPHGHHQHPSPQTPQAGYHAFPPPHPHPVRPLSSAGATPTHSRPSHPPGSQASPPPLLPPIRERSPHMHRPYERDPRR